MPNQTLDYTHQIGPLHFRNRLKKPIPKLQMIQKKESEIPTSPPALNKWIELILKIVKLGEIIAGRFASVTYFWP